MKIRNVKLSKTSTLHYLKLFFRGFLFIIAAIVYVFDWNRFPNDVFDTYLSHNWYVCVLWFIFVFEMILRFFPDDIESMGCQKQFAKNYIPQENPKPLPKIGKRTFICAISWIGLNSIIGALYYLSIVDRGFLILVSLAYSVCDMICILFFCPFQTWFLKNKCCGTCRIYNWDYFMIFTPLIFIPNIITWSLCLMSLILLIKWEVIHRMHRERFFEETNQALKCKNCKEKLCAHKKQLRKLNRKLALTTINKIEKATKDARSKIEKMEESDEEDPETDSPQKIKPD